MPSSFAPNGTLGIDQCLQAFLKAQTQEDAAGELARLMVMATPLIISSLSHRRGNPQPDDLEDAVSEARTHLLLHLQRLREERGSRAKLAVESGATILDFRAYVVAVARMAAAQLHRRRHPARAMLLNRLRYLLENRTNQRGFSVWTGHGGETWTGFETWADAHRFSTQTGERLGRLLADARPIAMEIFGTSGAEPVLPLAEIVARLFRWLDEPIRLRDLTDAVAEWQGIHAGRGEALSNYDDGSESLDALPSREPSPHDELRWKEYLCWLLQEASRLTLRQRSAFLLHSSCLREMELLGLTGVRQAAALLEIPPERMVEHWAKLPLEDRLIGTILGVATQQVINLRKVARGILGRAWQSFLQEN